MCICVVCLSLCAVNICCISLTKDVKERPRYRELLEHTLIKEYEEKPVDVGAWLRDIEKTVGL